MYCLNIMCVLDVVVGLRCHRVGVTGIGCRVGLGVTVRTARRVGARRLVWLPQIRTGVAMGAIGVRAATFRYVHRG